MAIDSSIYLQQRAPDIAGNIESGLKMSNLIREQQAAIQEQKKNKDIQDIYNQSVTKGPNGELQVDQPRFLSNLVSNGYGQEALKAQEGFKQQKFQDLENHNKILEQASNILQSVVDKPELYGAAREQILKLPSIKPEDLPESYDKSKISSIISQSMKASDQIAQALKQQEFGLNKQKVQSEIAKNYSEVKKNTEVKASLQDEKDAKLLDTHLSKGWTGRSGQAGVIQGKINSAEAAQALIDQGETQEGGLDSRQIEELAQSTARLLGSGTQASARVEALVPHTLLGKTQTLKEWLSGEPKGQEMQAFVDRLKETISREKSLAEDQQRKYQIEGLGQFGGLKKRNPQLFNEILQSKGISPEMIDEKGRYKKQSVPSGPPIGTIVDGHKFKGGDPNKQENWELQQ